MSRTFRRKNCGYGEKWFLKWEVDYLFDTSNPHYSYWAKYKSRRYGDITKDELVRRKKAHYHSDGYFAMNAPHWFGRLLDKSFTQKNKQNLHRALVWDIDFVPIAHKNNANYNWF